MRYSFLRLLKNHFNSWPPSKPFLSVYDNHRLHERISKVQLKYALFFFPPVQFLGSFLSESQRLRLAVRMKGLFRAIMGNPSGFYMLDLASAQGRMAAVKVRGCDHICSSPTSESLSQMIVCKDIVNSYHLLLLFNEIFDWKVLCCVSRLER